MLCVRHAPPAPALPYDAEVEYLESTGTQWLNCGIAPAPGMLITSRFALADRATVASDDVGAVPFYIYRTRGKQSGVRVTSGNMMVCADSAIAAVGAADTAWHDLRLDFSGIPTAAVDGVVAATAAAALPAAYGHTIDLFVYRTNWTFEPGYNSGAAICAGRIASFKVVDQATGDALVDLIPVRKDGVGYLYDRVSGTLLGNGGTGAFVIGPDKPYDYEVAYIERDCSIPWVDGDGTEIEGYFDLGQYADAAETLGTMRPLEATWSFEALSAGNVFALSRQTGLIYRGCMKSNNFDDYTFAPTSGQHSGISGDLAVMRTQRMEYSGGNIKGYMDGTLVVDVATSGGAKFNNARLMYSAKTTATHYSGKMRVAAAKIGNDVDLIPVVKGSAVGFYNKVDGELFLAEQACLSAGPAK